MLPEQYLSRGYDKCANKRFATALPGVPYAFGLRNVVVDFHYLNSVLYVMVNILKWNDSLSTGFEEIDLQHKKLILIIEDVHTAITASAAEYTLMISKALKKLTDYTHYHFTDEENFMKKNSFPGYETHKKEHEFFITQINTQITTLIYKSSDDGFQFYRFLGNWLLSHIAKSDQEWARWIEASTQQN